MSMKVMKESRKQEGEVNQLQVDILESHSHNPHKSDKLDN